MARELVIRSLEPCGKNSTVVIILDDSEHLVPDQDESDLHRALLAGGVQGLDRRGQLRCYMPGDPGFGEALKEQFNCFPYTCSDGPDYTGMEFSQTPAPGPVSMEVVSYGAA